MLFNVEKMEKISIIVPVYNSEKYIGPCLNSIINQNYANFEVIIINDGSNDNSLEICEFFKNKYSNIILLNKLNEGVSKARNDGIKKATGDYLLFVDSDDYLEPNALNKFEPYLKYFPDVIIGNYNIIKNNKKIGNISLEKKLLNKLEINAFLFPYFDLTYSHHIWGNLYKKSIINYNKILFDHNISMGEDLLFNIEVFNRIETLFIIPEITYNYVLELNILTKKFYSNYFYNRLYLIKQISKYYKMNNFDQNEIYYQIIKSSFASFMMIHNKGNLENFESKIARIDDVLKNNYLINAIKLYTTKNIFELILVTLFKLNLKTLIYTISYFAYIYKVIFKY